MGRTLNPVWTLVCSCSKDSEPTGETLPTNPAEVEVGGIVNINSVPGIVVYRGENNHGDIISLGEYYGIWGERDLDIGIKFSVSTDGLELFQMVYSLG